MASVAESAPASPYRPVIWDTMVTTPMPIMDSGIRPKKPAAENPLGAGGGEYRAVGTGQARLRYSEVMHGCNA